MTDLITTFKDHVGVVATTTGEQRNRALKSLWNFAECEEHKELLASSEIGLLPFLTRLVENHDTEDQVALANALGCIWYLARSVPNRELFGRKETGLVKALMSLNFSNHPQKNYSFLIFVNICLHPATHGYIFSEEIGMIRYYTDVIQRSRLIGDDDNPLLSAYRLFGNLTNVYLENQYIDILVHFNLPGMMIHRLLSKGSDPTQWIGRQGGIEYWALNCLLGFSATTYGAMILSQQSYPFIPFLWNLLSVHSLEAIKTSVILSNILGVCYPSVTLCSSFSCKTSSISSSSYGSFSVSSSSGPYACTSSDHFLEEVFQPDGVTSSMNSSKSFFLSDRSVLALLLDVYGATLKSGRGEESSRLSHFYDFTFGIITLPNILIALKNLVILDVTILPNTPRLLTYLIKTLQLFISDAPELSAVYSYRVYAGGGGKDYHSLTLALELLLQLSFLSASPSQSEKPVSRNSSGSVLRLLSSFLKRQKESSAVDSENSELMKTLKDLISLPSERNVPHEALVFVKLVLRQIEV
jgi:hypothetical protein